MPTATPRPAHDGWCDIDGSHISLFCGVEQVGEAPEPGALPSRLHQRGQVLGRSPGSLYVCFPDNQVVSVSPQLLRLLPATPDER